MREYATKKRKKRPVLSIRPSGRLSLPLCTESHRGDRTTCRHNVVPAKALQHQMSVLFLVGCTPQGCNTALHIQRHLPVLILSAVVPDDDTCTVSVTPVVLNPDFPFQLSGGIVLVIILSILTAGVLKVYQSVSVIILTVIALILRKRHVVLIVILCVFTTGVLKVYQSVTVVINSVTAEAFFVKTGTLIEKYVSTDPLQDPRASKGYQEAQIGFGWTNGVYLEAFLMLQML